MKLLDSEKTEVAFINETTARLTNWGYNVPVLIIYEDNADLSNGEPATERKMTVKKLEGLNGWFIKTDAGNEVKLTGTKEDILAQLEGLLGKKFGYNDEKLAKDYFGESGVKTYKKFDSTTPSTIDVVVTVNAPSEDYSGDEELTLTFARTPSTAVLVKDVIAKLPKFNGFAAVSLTDADGNELKLNDKVTEDGSYSVNWNSGTEITVKNPNAEGEDAIVDIPFGTTTQDALAIIQNDETVASWISNAETEFLGFTLIDGSEIPENKFKKAASKIIADGVALAFAEPVVEPTEMIISGDSSVSMGSTITLTTNVESGTVTWESSDDTIATVEDGVVTPAAPGEVTITASAAGYTDGTKTITVNAGE